MAARWNIISDKPREDLTRAGTFEAVRVIEFEMLDTGSTGEVIVSLRNYTPEYVQTVIQQYADTIDAVGRLRSS